MTRDITQELLDQLPVVVRPDSVDVEGWQIQSRLASINRQQTVLYIAQWLHENEAQLGQVDFELAYYDGRVSLQDEIAVGEDVDDPDELTAAVELLAENLDSMGDDTNAELLGKLIKGLNKAHWNMPQAWQVLVDFAPLPAKESAADWLNEHRAAWQQAEMDQKTSEVSATAPRPRM